MRLYYTPKDIERFWSKVDMSGGCWMWRAGCDTHGYGKIGIQGTHCLAHRVSYELSHGVIPLGLCVLHRCDTPRCVNPAHLFLGTHKDNSDDMYAKGRDRHATGDQNGSRRYPERLAWGDRNWARQNRKQMRGENGPSAKLTAAQVREIHLRYQKRVVSYGRLAKEYGVTKGTIAHIIQGLSWRDD